MLPASQIMLNNSVPVEWESLTLMSQYHCKDYDYVASQCKSHYENKPIQIYWKIYHQKNENFRIKIQIFFHISAQNIDCGYSLEPPHRGSNEYPQSMFLSRNKTNNVYPCKPQFYYIKVGFKGVKII